MIRRAAISDHPWMTEVAAEVYRELGDYGSILPSWLEHPGVLAYLDESAKTRRGFILLGFYQPEDLLGGAFVADLLAIAVHPAEQRQGLGRALLQKACDLAVLAGHSNPVAELRLTVADGNEAGQRLFRWGGFEVIDDCHGAYDGGQRAIRMARHLPTNTREARATVRHDLPSFAAGSELAPT